MFRDHVAHQAAGSDYSGARAQHGNDARDRAALCSGRNCNNRLAALGARSSAQEVHLAADAAVKLVAYRVGANLAGKINLQSGVDRHHIVIACDPLRIVGVSGWSELKNRIIVHEIEKLLGSEGEPDNDLARLKILPRSG